MKLKNDRKSFLIHPRFQMTFLGFMFLVFLTTIFEVYLAHLYFFRKFYQLGHSMQLDPNHVFFKFIQQEQTSMNWVFICLSAMMLVSLLICGLIFSHKIAGPLHRLKTHLQNTVQSGQTKTFHFRKGDFFQDLAEAYNQYLQKNK
jgi:hypothetical protein